MRKSITVNIPEPCHEDWNKMSPKDKGRHCAACNKTVIDFTKQTDEQIIKHLESEGNLCGRFKKQQLNREIVLARKDRNNYLSWAASGILALMSLGSQNVQAQEPPKIVHMDSVKVPQVKGKIATSILGTKLISGVVTDSTNNLPMAGVNVMVKNSTHSVETDKDGKYVIKVKKGDVLVFSHLGFDSKELKINKTASINIKLENNRLEIMGEVAGGIRVIYNDKKSNK